MIRNALQRFMYGRYGNDQLNLFLVIAYVILSLLATVTKWGILALVGDVCVLWMVFRTLSRNLSKRREENTRFLNRVRPILQWIRVQKSIYRDKEHRYFRCPNCSQYLRVPRGKGKITVTCRNCGATFQEKS